MFERASDPSGITVKRACISVQLRNSHLHPGATFLPYMVAVHDVENLIPDGLSIAPPPHTPQHVAHPLLSSSPCPSMCLNTTHSDCVSHLHCFGTHTGSGIDQMPATLLVLWSQYRETCSQQICQSRRVDVASHDKHWPMLGAAPGLCLCVTSCLQWSAPPPG